MLRAAQMLATPGRYRCMVKDLHLVIATNPRVTMAPSSENVIVEDMARLLVVDGVTIPQVWDAHEWASLVLQIWVCWKFPAWVIICLCYNPD